MPMPRAPLLLFLLVSLLQHDDCHVVHASASVPPFSPTLGVDMPAFLSTHDLVWSFDASTPDPLAPTRWYSGAYIGNGLLGAMVTAVPSAATNGTSALRLDIGRTDLWIGAERQPVGSLTVSPQASPLAHVDLRVVLANATLFVDFTLVNGDVIHFSVFINGADPEGPLGVLCLFVSTLTGGEDPLVFDWTPDTTGVGANVTVAAGSQGGTAWGTDILYFTQGGQRDGTYTTAFTNFNFDCGQTLILAVASDQRGGAAWSSLGVALASVAAGVGASVEDLEAAHAAWWADFWSAQAGGAFFSFSGDAPLATALEGFTHIALYRYASAARFSMHDLMGPWGPGGPGVHGATYCVGPWCQFCWDMNQQVMLYLPTGASNRGALLATPALDMLDALNNGTWAARYGSNPPGDGVNTLWLLAAAHRYALLHGDDARLVRAVLPALRASLANGAGLSNGTDGRLHIVGCKSPEYPMKPANDCSYHLAILQWAAQTAAAMARALSPADPDIIYWDDIAARIAPLPIDASTGSFEIALDVPFAVPHRHYSHLLALYDLGQADSVGTMAASLDVWFNITCAGPQAHGPDYNGDDECRGFTQAAMAAMSARLNRSTAVLGNLTSFLTLVGLPNGMYGEEVYAGEKTEFSAVQESAYSAAASTMMMMIDSAPWPPAPQSGRVRRAGDAPQPVRIWPAAPFSNATFFRLRAQSALLISATRVRGETVWVAIEADVLADGTGAGDLVPVTLYVPDWEGHGALNAIGAPGVVVAAVNGVPGLFSVDGLMRGQAVGMWPLGSAQPDFTVRVADGRNATEFNYWGGRFVYNGEWA